MRRLIILAMLPTCLAVTTSRAAAQFTTPVTQLEAERVRAQLDSLAFDVLAERNTRISPEALQLIQTQIDTAARTVAQLPQETKRVNAELGFRSYVETIVQEGTRVRLFDEGRSEVVTLVEERDVQAAMRRCVSWILWPVICERWRP